jgi:hypothetical protein
MPSFDLDWIGNMDLTVLLDGKASGGRLTVIEVHAQRGDAMPVQVHGNEDETFVVRLPSASTT